VSWPIWRLPGLDSCRLHSSVVSIACSGARSLCEVWWSQRGDACPASALSILNLDAFDSITQCICCLPEFTSCTCSSNLRSCPKSWSHSQACACAPCVVAKSCSLSCNTPQTNTCHAFGQVLAACTHLLVSAVRSWNPAPAPARPLFVIHRASSPGVSPSTAPKTT